jgi:hypothetical protein
MGRRGNRRPRPFTKLNLGYRSHLTDFYKDHLFETMAGFEGTRHVLWTHQRTEHGYPGHKSYGGRIMPLNGHLVFKNDDFRLAGDEALVTVCGVSICCQTAHMVVMPRKTKPPGPVPPDALPTPK